jgi:hypothetical protein
MDGIFFFGASDDHYFLSCGAENLKNTRIWAGLAGNAKKFSLIFVNSFGNAQMRNGFSASN